jgi:hypothetical protein
MSVSTIFEVVGETCSENLPHLITSVETTAATTQDQQVVTSIHQSLKILMHSVQELKALFLKEFGGLGCVNVVILD